ncbi:MAG: AbiEi antitoxin N-terminal domain-containing protein [Dehalococcoidia bacterium]
MNPGAEQVIELVREKGVVRPRDLAARGLSRHHLQRLTDAGLLERVGRGLYSLPDVEVTEHRTLAEVAARVPHGIIALLSALQLHGLTSQMPHRVWVAVGEKDRLPTTDLPIRFVRFSGAALTEGIEERVIDGVTARVTSPARTVADCFKYRNKIGLDIAVEALRLCIETRKCNRSDLWRYATIDRVANVIRPYLEALS